MNAARIVVLMIAVAAGGGAYMLARGTPPAPSAPAATPLPTVGVLVARRDIGIGQTLTDDDLGWQTWPKKAAVDPMIQQTARPQAISELKGAVARGTFVAGEPIREQKLIRAGGSGFLSAMLPSGMRAVSAEITEDRRAGGFILPNDRVDVLVTRRAAMQKGEPETLVSETILTNVRVLAIGQTIEDKEGQRSVTGKATATLELSPKQAEVLSLASEAGTLSLALRSLADSSPTKPGDGARETNSMSIVRFGVPTVTTIR